MASRRGYSEIDHLVAQGRRGAGHVAYMMARLVAVALGVTLFAQVHTAVPLHQAQSPRLCRTSTASSTCTPQPQATVPWTSLPSWTRA